MLPLLFPFFYIIIIILINKGVNKQSIVMLSNIFIISVRGEVLLEENYRYDIPDQDLKFLLSTIWKSKLDQTSPCFKTHNIYGYYVTKEKNIYLAVSKTEVPAVVVIEFFENFYLLIRNFCGGATEDHITKNILLIYELLTECVENGLIKIHSTEQVRHSVYSDPIITTLNQKSEIKKPGPFGLEKVFIPNLAAERPLVKSRSQQNLKTEVFADVIEKLTAHFSKEGLLQRFYLTGVIQLKSFIPHNHRIIVHIEDNNKQEGTHKGICFHQHQFDSSVDFKSFERNQSFSVTPLHEEIKVLTYCMKSAAELPFRLISNIQKSDKNRDCDLTLKLSCNLPSSVETLNLLLHIPISSCTRNVMQQFSELESTAEFIQKEKKILWKLKKLSGQREVVAKFKLIEAFQVAANCLEMGPVSLEFEVSNTACSGIGIRNLKAEDPVGKTIPIQKWVRYVTLAQSYVFSL